MVTHMGLPVPEGFTIDTAGCAAHAGKKKLYSALKGQVTGAISALVRETGLQFGGYGSSTKDKPPLLVSVRSGAPVSMPGMMETILNLGLNDSTVKSLAAVTNDDFAWDSYRRFVTMYGTIVNGADPRTFKARYEAAKAFAGSDKLEADMLEMLVNRFKKDTPIPDDPMQQLEQAILAVYRSWNAPKAVAYREIENISGDMGTAVNVQRMVFGNMNDNSGTGVAFTRDPNTGENVRFGDFLINAQGEDVVDGSHVTTPLADMGNVFPEQAKQLESIMSGLESEFRDMCDIEFTIEDGKLWMLQTRTGKRCKKAALRIAVEMATEGLISPEVAVERIEASGVGSAATVADSGRSYSLAGSGTGACPGIVEGQAYFNSEDAVLHAGNGPVILIRTETSPDDVKGMAVSAGILTATGGLVSHAAVVARGWEKPCVVGCGDLTVDYKSATVGMKRINQGDWVKIDGTTGEVFTNG